MKKCSTFAAIALIAAALLTACNDLRQTLLGPQLEFSVPKEKMGQDFDREGKQLIHLPGIIASDFQQRNNTVTLIINYSKSASKDDVIKKIEERGYVFLR